MPSARPTEPGHYWARVRGGVRWRPCELWVCRDYQCALFTGDARDYDPDVGIEWGPAILEYRGEGGG